MIEQTLKKLGLSTKETIVYLEVMRRGKSTPTAIAKATGINRTSIYHVSESLKEKGFIEEDLGGKSMYLVAIPPEELQTLIQKEKQHLKKKETLVCKAIEDISQIARDTHYAIPKIRFVEEKKLENFLYSRFETWNGSILKYDNTWWGFQDHTFAEQFQDWIDNFWQKSPKGIIVKLLSNSSDIEKGLKRRKKYPNRHVLYWKKSFQFTATLWALGDYIVMVFTHERPFYLIEIHNPVLALNMRAFFESVWEDVEKK